MQQKKIIQTISNNWLIIFELSDNNRQIVVL